MQPAYNAVVIVTSDSCFKDPTLDESGPYVVEELERTTLFAYVKKHIIRDDKLEIMRCLKTSLATDNPALIITIGGTGLCPRDVTPEATSALYDKSCSGITAGLHSIGLRYSPHAALSRLTSGIIGQTLVVNFPGKLKACQDYTPWLVTILEHALEQVRNDLPAYRETHKKQDASFKAPASIAPDDSVSNGPSPSVVSASGHANNISGLMGLLDICDPPLVVPAYNNNNTAKGKKKKGPPSHPPTRSLVRSGSASTQNSSSRVTIDDILESRCDAIPMAADSRSEIGHNNRQASRAPSSIRSLKTRIISPKHNNVQKTITTNLPKVRIMPIQSKFEQIDFKQSLDILGTMAKQLLGEPVEKQLINAQVAMSCLGCVLARDLVPKRIVPAHSVSTMDGYVLNIPAAMKGAIENGQIKTMPAARLSPSLKQFENERKQKDNFICYQVNTGGRLPQHNFAVIPVEKTGEVRVDPNSNSRVVPIYEVKQHAYVRRAGTDIGKNDTLMAGTVIGPVEMCVIMASGHESIFIYQRPKIGVLSTGDELVDFFAAKKSARAYGGDDDSVVDTNGPLLTFMFRTKGFHAVSLGVARDDPDEICAKLQEGLEKYDVILVTGGASMGSKDHVKSVIAHLGGKIHFGRVNIKPGKPVAFASLDIKGKQKFIFSLPGNPVSAYITTTILVMPFIQNGLQKTSKPDAQITFDSVGDYIEAEVVELLDGKSYPFDGRLEFLRAKIVARKQTGTARPLFEVKISIKQQSSRMLNLVDCDCLVMIDPSLKGKSLSVGTKYPALKLHRQY